MEYWKSRLTLLIAAFALLTSASAAPVILFLKGGDRVTGNITFEDGKVLKISTSWKQELSIPLELIERREAINATAGTGSNTNTVAGRSGTNLVGGVAVNAGTNGPAKPKPPAAWTGEAQIGLDVARGSNNRQLYYSRFKLTYAKNRWRNTFDYKSAYETTDGNLTANRMDGSIKTDLDLTNRFFIYNLGTAGYDEVRKIDLQYELGPGIGYHVVKTTNFVLNAEFGAFYTHIDYITDDDRDEVSLRLAESLMWKINSRFSVDEKLEFLPTADDLGMFRLRFETTLKYLLSQRLSLNVTILDIYDTRPASNVARNDLQIRSSLGLKF